ncbi:MAG: hypothetical protein WBN22_02145 [Verrucomicrobiia bacterium]
MKSKACFLLVAAFLFPAPCCRAGNYTNFDVAIYIPVREVLSFENPQKLQDDWSRISAQLKVDKVYIEVQRNRELAGDELLERVKKFFLDRGVRVAGGMALFDDGFGQFKSFCYTDPPDREFVQHAAELAARHFDEVIQDDFFFNNTKTDSDIAAKGTNSWTQFRLALMDDVAENLIIKPARAINPNIKLVIKFPNWYEHFQGLGYDLDREPKLFDGIYTGTETRDPVVTDQHLQQYESYEIIRYFDNIAPGRNGGGWVDTFSIQYIDRYAEQLWDTMFAKAPQIMLFEWSAMSRPIVLGDRAAWQDLPTSFNYDQMLKSFHPDPSIGLTNPVIASVASYSLKQVDPFLGRLGNPIGVASYKPYQSTGEDFLQNYLGMIGIPIEMYPYFPTNADLVLLTEEAKFDPDIVAKIKQQLVAGKSVVITSGLLHALKHRGINDIVELRYTGRQLLAHEFYGGFGAGNGADLGDDPNAAILLPVIEFFTNDAWPLVRAMANGGACPLLLMDRYTKGVLYVLTIPDNFADLYRLPPAVTSAIKGYLMRGFPVRLDGPGQVALFAYDNHTFIVESYRPTETDVKISTTEGFTKLRNLVTGEEIAGQAPEEPRGFERRRQFFGEKRESFNVHLLPHSYEVFEMEK